MAYISAQRLTLRRHEITAGSGINQTKPRVGRTNSPAHQLRRQGYRTIGEVCAAAGVSDSTLIGWEGRFISPMTKVNGVRAIPSEKFDKYVDACIRLRETRCQRQRKGAKQA